MAITDLRSFLSWLDGTISPGPKVQVSGSTLPTGAATAANQTDGSQLARAMGIDGATQRQVKVDATGQVYVANPPASPETGLAKEATLAGQLDAKTSTLATHAKQDAQTAAIQALDDWTEYPATWATVDGVTEIEIAGIPAGKYNAKACSWSAVSDGVAVSIAVHVCTDTGFTPGSAVHGFYSSDAAIALPAQRYESCLDVPITIGAAGKAYVRAVTNASTSTGAISLYLHPVG